MWTVTHKGDAYARSLADKHYTRQTPGAAMFTRPGYSAVLIYPGAVWVWWRPKWEDGRPGTARKDGLRALECTLFRREPECDVQASSLVAAAEAYLWTQEVREALHLDTAGTIDWLLTAIGVAQTQHRRSRHAKPGVCYRKAGWKDADPKIRPPLKGKLWLVKPCPVLIS